MLKIYCLINAASDWFALFHLISQQYFKYWIPQIKSCTCLFQYPFSSLADGFIKASIKDFYRLSVLPDAKPTVSKHWRKNTGKTMYTLNNHHNQHINCKSMIFTCHTGTCKNLPLRNTTYLSKQNITKRTFIYGGSDVQ